VTPFQSLVINAEGSIPKCLLLRILPGWKTKWKCRYSSFIWPCAIVHQNEIVCSLYTGSFVQVLLGPNQGGTKPHPKLAPSNRASTSRRLSFAKNSSSLVQGSRVKRGASATRQISNAVFPLDWISGSQRKQVPICCSISVCAWSIGVLMCCCSLVAWRREVNPMNLAVGGFGSL
jgi:hypothetical protein